MEPSAEVQQRLARIGWRVQAIPADAPANASIARVVAQHRAGYELHDGVETFNAQPAPRFLKRGIDPAERPAVGDFVLVSPGSPAFSTTRPDSISTGPSSPERESRVRVTEPSR